MAATKPDRAYEPVQSNLEARATQVRCSGGAASGHRPSHTADLCGLLLPLSLTWSENRYELAAFRFTNQQLLDFPGTHFERQLANPYWGASLSRRWRLFERGPVEGFVGFGLSVKTESDTLSSTPWDFASQPGLRFQLLANRVVGELTMRHWSNGGIRLPNHGQDFVTVTLRLASGPFGFGGASQNPISPPLGRERLRGGDYPGGDQQLLP